MNFPNKLLSHYNIMYKYTLTLNKITEKTSKNAKLKFRV